MWPSTVMSWPDIRAPAAEVKNKMVLAMSSGEISVRSDEMAVSPSRTAASLWPVMALAPQPGERVLDVASGVGPLVAVIAPVATVARFDDRGVELVDEVLTYEHCLINRQVENGIAARMAVLYWLQPAVIPLPDEKEEVTP